MRITTMAVKTNTATVTATITTLVKACIDIVSAQEKLADLANKWAGDEFTVADGQEFSASYRVAYLKKFKDKSASQVTSAVTSAMTSVRLSMFLAGKKVTVYKNKKIVEWQPSEALLKTRKIGTPTTPTTPTTPAATTPPAQGTDTPPVQSSQAAPTKEVAMEALNKVIAYMNTRNGRSGGQDAIKMLTSIARMISDD